MTAEEIKDLIEKYGITEDTMLTVTQMIEEGKLAAAGLFFIRNTWKSGGFNLGEIKEATLEIHKVLTK